MDNICQCKLKTKNSGLIRKPGVLISFDVLKTTDRVIDKTFKNIKGNSFYLLGI